MHTATENRIILLARALAAGNPERIEHHLAILEAKLAPEAVASILDAILLGSMPADWSTPALLKEGRQSA